MAPASETVERVVVRDVVPTAEDSRENDSLPPPPRWLRIVLTIVGCTLVGLGLIGLALPVVPQMVPLVAGATALTFADERLYQALQRGLRRWPRLRTALRRTRQRVHNRLVRWFPKHYEKHDDTNPAP